MFNEVEGNNKYAVGCVIISILFICCTMTSASFYALYYIAQEIQKEAEVSVQEVFVQEQPEEIITTDIPPTQITEATKTPQREPEVSVIEIEGFPQGIDIYPGSKLEKSTTNAFQYITSHQFEFLIADVSQGEIYDFYMDEFSKDGWELSYENDTGMYIFSVKKDIDYATLSVMNDYFNDGGVKVVIYLTLTNR